jgi:hypothetical protein
MRRRWPWSCGISLFRIIVAALLARLYEFEQERSRIADLACISWIQKNGMLV